MQRCDLSPMLGLHDPDADARIRLCYSARLSGKSSGWERSHRTAFARVKVLLVGKHEIGISLEKSHCWSMKLGCLIPSKQHPPWHVLWWIFLFWALHATFHLGNSFSRQNWETKCLPIQPTLSSLDHTKHIFWAVLGFYYCRQSHSSLQPKKHHINGSFGEAWNWGLRIQVWIIKQTQYQTRIMMMIT